MIKYTVVFANKEDQFPNIQVIGADDDKQAIELANVARPEDSELIAVLTGDVRVVYPTR